MKPIHKVSNFLCYSRNLNQKRYFDANSWLTSVSEELSQLTCHEMNQKIWNLTIVEKERCDKEALESASEGIV